ncbi:hypothetical protein TNCV_299201 [Trichonephila clavipes]|nr:hypothetical protein TNCV_299201 [Trichonephila clavipes]
MQTILITGVPKIFLRVPSSPSLIYHDALSTLETAMKWYEQQSECCPTQLLLLKRVGDLAAKKRRCAMLQQEPSGQDLQSWTHVLCPLKTGHGEKLMNVKSVEAQTPHVVVMWKSEEWDVTWSWLKITKCVTSGSSVASKTVV